MLKTVEHPLAPADRKVMDKLRAATAGVALEFVPESRAFYDDMIGHTPAVPGVTYEAASVGGVAGWWCQPPGAEAGAAVLFLHGGAYVLGSAGAYRNFVGQICERANVVAFVPDYRLAPEHPFPAAVEDGLAAYRGLDVLGFMSIALVGDSAGGGIALTLLPEIDRVSTAPAPRCVAAMSPWADLTLSGRSVVDRAAADPFLKPAPLLAAAARYLAGHEGHDPRASPVFADFSNLATVPAMMLQVGHDEILLDDARRCAMNAADAGGDVELHIWAGMPHVFQTNLGLLRASDEALNEIGAFLRQHLATAAMPIAM